MRLGQLNGNRRAPGYSQARCLAATRSPRPRDSDNSVRRRAHPSASRIGPTDGASCPESRAESPYARVAQGIEQRPSNPARRPHADALMATLRSDFRGFRQQQGRSRHSNARTRTRSCRGVVGENGARTGPLGVTPACHVAISEEVEVGDAGQRAR